MAVQTPEIAAGTGDHVVQFYDRDSELARAVSGHLAEAIRAGDALVVIATPDHRAAFRNELAAAGVDLGWIDRDRVVLWLDAGATLSRVMLHGRVDADAFEAVVGGIVRDAGASGARVRAYGEMVALLWDAGDVLAAIELEKLWNQLSRKLHFSLWCAYHGHSLAVHEHADELREVCHLHTSVMSEATAHFAAGVDGPLAARRFVSSVLARRPYEGRVDPCDAKLLVSELATNAVIHTGTPFAVSVRCDGSTVRIGVRDWSPVRPALRNSGPNSLSGRGLHLVAALAGDWGVDSDPDGKTVWADLALR